MTDHLIFWFVKKKGGWVGVCAGGGRDVLSIDTLRSGVRCALCGIRV